MPEERQGACPQPPWTNDAQGGDSEKTENSEKREATVEDDSLASLVAELCRRLNRDTVRRLKKARIVKAADSS
ncbi:MAG: hypothetical protein ACPGOV_17355 [Magnetovibrionaceae bacterium]